jgi:hypothetical protein
MRPGDFEALIILLLVRAVKKWRMRSAALAAVGPETVNDYRNLWSVMAWAS